MGVIGNDPYQSSYFSLSDLPRLIRTKLRSLAITRAFRDGAMGMGHRYEILEIVFLIRAVPSVVLCPESTDR